MKIKTSHSTLNVHLSYDEGDEKALTQTEVVLKEILATLDKEDCTYLKSDTGQVTRRNLEDALYAIQELLYNVPFDTEAW